VQLAISRCAAGPSEYHTSLLVGGREYFFSRAGIMSFPWLRSHAQLGASAAPRVVDVGATSLATPGEGLLEVLGEAFAAGTFDEYEKNANSFSDCALFVLLGQRLDPTFARLRYGVAGYSSTPSKFGSQFKTRSAFDMEAFIASLVPGEEVASTPLAELSAAAPALSASEAAALAARPSAATRARGGGPVNFWKDKQASSSRPLASAGVPQRQGISSIGYLDRDGSGQPIVCEIYPAEAVPQRSNIAGQWARRISPGQPPQQQGFHPAGRRAAYVEVDDEGDETDASLIEEAVAGFQDVAIHGGSWSPRKERSSADEVHVQRQGASYSTAPSTPSGFPADRRTPARAAHGPPSCDGSSAGSGACSEKSSPEEGLRSECGHCEDDDGGNLRRWGEAANDDCAESSGSLDLSPSPHEDEPGDEGSAAEGGASVEVISQITAEVSADSLPHRSSGDSWRRSREAEAEDEQAARALQRQLDEEARQERSTILRGARSRNGSSSSSPPRAREGSGDAAPGDIGGIWTRFLEECARVQLACGCVRPLTDEPELIAQGEGLFFLSPEDTFNTLTTVYTHDGTPDQSAAGTCGVCLDTYLAGEEVRTLPCSHRFHRECIDKWLLKRLVCPTCKTSITST